MYEDNKSDKTKEGTTQGRATGGAIYLPGSKNRKGLSSFPPYSLPENRFILILNFSLTFFAVAFLAVASILKEKAVQTVEVEYIDGVYQFSNLAEYLQSSTMFDLFSFLASFSLITPIIINLLRKRIIPIKVLIANVVLLVLYMGFALSTPTISSLLMQKIDLGDASYVKVSALQREILTQFNGAVRDTEKLTKNEFTEKYAEVSDNSIYTSKDITVDANIIKKGESFSVEIQNIEK